MLPRSSYRNIPSVENLALGELPTRPPVAPRIITDTSITIPHDQRSSYYDPRIIRRAAISPKGSAYATLDASGAIYFYYLNEKGLFQKGGKIGDTTYNDSKFLTKWKRVHLSVTDIPDSYVAISYLPDEERIIRERQGEINTPTSGWFSNRSWHEWDNRPHSKLKLNTIEILRAADKKWKPPESLANLEGRATFLHDSSRLIVLSQRMVYIYSTSTWNLLQRLNTTLLEIPAVDNDFDYCNVRCLQKGYLGLYVATDRFIVWSIETRDLVMQFRHGFTLFERRYCDNYFSMNSELLALFNPKESMLKVFTVENGLCIVTRKIEKNVDLVDFLDSGELVLFQDMWVDFYDPYTGRKSRTKGVKCDYTPGETIFFHGGRLFNSSSGGDPKVSGVIPVPSYEAMDGATVPLTHQPVISDDGTVRVYKLKNDTIFVDAPGFEGQINILSGEETHVRFISPMRFLIVYGRFMEVWLITNEERKSLKLQWAWYPKRILDEGDPLAYQNIIKKAVVSTDTQKVYARVAKQGSDSDDEEVVIQLPLTDEPYSLDILQDACKNIPLFEKEDFDHIGLIREIIWHCIPKYPYAFNRIRPSYFPIHDLMAINRPFADQYITEILKHEKWVPLTNQDGKNALMIALDHQRPPMITLLVRYCITKAKEEDCEYMKMVVDCLPILCKQFPDLVAQVAKELVYYKCNPDGSTPRFFSTKPPRPGTTGRSANRNFEAYQINTSLRSDKTIFQKATHLVFWRFPGWIGQFTERILKRTPHSIVTCVVALPGLSQYPLPETDKSRGWHSMDNMMARFRKWFWPRSVFSEVVIQMELFKEAKLMYPIIFFKWKTYARTMFLITSFLYLIFFGFFIAATALAPNSPSYVPATAVEVVLSWLIIVMASLFLVQEFRQIIGLGLYYWISPYNYIELGSFSLPMLWSLFNLGFIPGEMTPGWLAPVGILALWILILLQMRIISQRLGIFLAIVIEIFKRTVPFLFVFTIILFAFSHSLWLLLRYTDQQPSGNFTGSLFFQNKTVASQIELGSVQGPNPFGTFMYSLYAVFFFLEQDYSPLDTFDVVDNIPLVIIKVLFTFSTTIILLNVLIALLNSVFSTTQELGERVWLREMATWIAECEVFLMFPWQRKNAEFFPRYIFYEAYTEKVSEWGESITIHRADYATRQDVREVKSNVDSHIAVIRDEIDHSQQKITSEIGDIRMALNETKDLLEGQLMDLKLLMQEIQGEVVTVETVSDVLEEPQFATENPRLSMAERSDVAEEDPMDVGGPRDTDLWS